MIRFALIAVALSCALTVPPAAAKEAKTKITEKQVQEYYETRNSSHKLSFAEYEAVLKKSYSPDFTSTLTSILHSPGSPSATTTDTPNYQSIVNSAKDAYQSMKTATVDGRTSGIKIAADGQSVKALHERTLKGARFATPQGELLIDTDSKCEDELALNAENILQAVKSTCTAESVITSKTGQ